MCMRKQWIQWLLLHDHCGIHTKLCISSVLQDSDLDSDEELGTLV